MELEWSRSILPARTIHRDASNKIRNDNLRAFSCSKASIASIVQVNNTKTPMKPIENQVGRRTGVSVKKAVRKDSLGFEAVDEYFSRPKSDKNTAISCQTVIGKRSGVVLPRQVSKDSMGFEDMEAFWASKKPIEKEPEPVVETQPELPQEEEEEERPVEMEIQNFDDDMDDDDNEPLFDPFDENEPLSMFEEETKTGIQSPNMSPIQPMSGRDAARLSFGTPETCVTPSRRLSYSTPKSTTLASPSLSRTSSYTKRRRYSQTPKYAMTPISTEKQYGYMDTTDDTYSITQLDISADSSSIAASSDDEEDDEEEEEVEEDLDDERKNMQEILNSTTAQSPAGPLRRSKRRRFAPLAWYKGEHLVYERRKSGVGVVVPTVKGVERAGTKTPKPRAKKPKESFKSSKKDSAMVWDEKECTGKVVDIVKRKNKVQHRSIPVSGERPPPQAAQTFNVQGFEGQPSWISGVLELPPRGMKEPEGVGECTQVFYVDHGQSNALEVAIAIPLKDHFDEETAQRIRLSPGDEFYVPPNNSYMLWNHSKRVKSTLRFMIVKPTAS